MDQLDATAAHRPVAMRHILAATTGNALEFYDFMVFAFFAKQIGEAFFPATDPYASLMASLATFGAGFLTRPLGALVLGRYGDRHGRAPAMMLSMGLMGFSILALVICPGYAQIGIAAPVIAVLSRLVQGFAIGGEVGPSTAYMLEGTSPYRRGFIVSFQRASQTLAQAVGAVIGLIFSLALSQEAFHDYGWRLTLGIGALVAPYALYLRRRMPEGPPPHTAEDNAAELERGFARAAIVGFLIISGGTVGAYVSTYLATFAQTELKLSPAVAMAAQTASFLVATIACLVGGAVTDRLGRRPVMLFGFGLCTLLTPPLFAWTIAHPGLGVLMLTSSILGILGGFGVSAAMVAIVESLPRRARSVAFSLVYTLPVTIFGGTTQLIVTWLVKLTGTPMAVAWYSAGAMALGTLAMLAMPESSPVRRRVLAQA